MLDAAVIIFTSQHPTTPIQCPRLIPIDAFQCVRACDSTCNPLCVQHSHVIERSANPKVFIRHQNPRDLTQKSRSPAHAREAQHANQTSNMQCPASNMVCQRRIWTFWRQGCGSIHLSMSTITPIQGHIGLLALCFAGLTDRSTHPESRKKQKHSFVSSGLNHTPQPVGDNIPT